MFLIYTITERAQDGTAILTNATGYDTSYNGVDLAVRKRMSNNFLVNGGLNAAATESQL